MRGRTPKMINQKLNLNGIKHIRLILPFKLPTWNQLLAMNRWERKRVRDWIHLAVLQCIRQKTEESDIYKLKLNQLQKDQYLQMITPNALKKRRLKIEYEKMSKV